MAELTRADVARFMAETKLGDLSEISVDKLNKFCTQVGAVRDDTPVKGDSHDEEMSCDDVHICIVVIRLLDKLGILVRDP